MIQSSWGLGQGLLEIVGFKVPGTYLPGLGRFIVNSMQLCS
jgi:hypothetical protein